MTIKSCFSLVEEAKQKIKNINFKNAMKLHNEGETIFGSRTAGQYFVRRYEDGEEMGGGFFKTIEEAETEVREYQQSEQDIL